MSLLNYSYNTSSSFTSTSGLPFYSQAQRFRDLIRGKELVQLPGVYDCISAKVCEKLGFKAVYTSGLSIAAASLGMPDVGLLTASENLHQVARIVNSINIPVLADCDTGYGNASNVYRLTQDLIKIGVAAMTLEDQVWPKKCGHFEGKQVIPMEEHMSKIRAAAKARDDMRSPFVVVARTDARAPLGLEEAIRRAGAYAAAGADMVFVEAPQSQEELETIASTLKGIPLLANFIEGGKTPIKSAQQLQDLGYIAVLYSTSGILASMQALTNVYGTILNNGSSHAYRPSMAPFKDLLDLVDLDGVMTRESECSFIESASATIASYNPDSASDGSSSVSATATITITTTETTTVAVEVGAAANQADVCLRQKKNHQNQNQNKENGCDLDSMLSTVLRSEVEQANSAARFAIRQSDF